MMKSIVLQILYIALVVASVLSLCGGAYIFIIGCVMAGPGFFKAEDGAKSVIGIIALGIGFCGLGTGLVAGWGAHALRKKNPEKFK